MKPFVAIDFETANEKRASACAVGLVRYDEDGQEAGQFTTLLRPHEDLDWFSYRNIQVHGITADDVVGAPTWNDVHPDITDFAGDLPLVAHNMAFDGYVLSDLASLYGLNQAANRRMCTLRLSRRLLATELRSKSLDLVFRYYFPADTFIHHEASADARACGRIFARMQSEYGYEHLEKLCPPTGVLTR